MTTTKTLQMLRIEIDLLKSTQRDRVEKLQDQIDELHRRVSKLDQAKPDKPGKKQYKQGLIPIPEKPREMVELGIGEEQG
jgi:hypothetical protein